MSTGRVRGIVRQATPDPSGTEARPGADGAFRLFSAAVEALPIPAALTARSGEVFCANRRLLDWLGFEAPPATGALWLPVLDGGMTTGALPAPEVQTGRIWLGRYDGRIIDTLVVVVGLGREGWRLYLLAEAASAHVQTGQAAPTAVPQPPPLFGALTPREAEVLRHLVAEGSNKAVARRLGISPRTVEVHRHRVLQKLGTRTLSQAIAVAIATGLDLSAPSGEDVSCGAPRSFEVAHAH